MYYIYPLLLKVLNFGFGFFKLTDSLLQCNNKIKTLYLNH